MREREESSVLALSKMKKDFYMILSEIERAQEEKTPYSAATKTFPVETTFRSADEGGVDDVVFEWLGRDAVFRNVQLIITSPPEIQLEAWIQVHAWQDDEVRKVRHWQTEEIEKRSLAEFQANRTTMLTTLERAYTTVCNWGQADLTRIGTL